jgi:hypothetical protein
MSGSAAPNPVHGIELPVINQALKTFEAKTDGDVTFGTEAAVLSRPEGAERLTSQPAAVHYLDENIGTLTAVVFKYYDGTGARSGDKVEDSTKDGYYMEGAKILPQVDEDAQEIHGDLHLPLASFKGEGDPQPDTDTRLLAGSLSLFGRFGELVEIGYLGQNNLDFRDVMESGRIPEPTVTKTISPSRLEPPFSIRFGSGWHHDVRAVYNRYMGISQIAAFIKLQRAPNGQVSPAQADMIERLGAIEPVRGKPQPPRPPLQRR